MSNFSQIVANLQSERNRVQKELQRLDDAISALSNLGGKNGVVRASAAVRGSVVTGKARRRLSPAARKRIADAQRQRWAKFRQQKSNPRKAA